MVLSAQAQAQAQAFQAAVNAGQGAANNRNMWNMQGFPPPMLGGLPPNFFPHFQAAAQAQQEATTSMVGTAKLGTSSKVPSSNSKFVVRSSVRKFDSSGAIVSVGMWARKVVEDNLEWLVKLARRHSPSENAVILAYGDGCETLVLMDSQINTLPKDFGKIKKVGVGVSVALADSKVDEGNLANTGVLQAQDSIWEHLSFQTADAAKTKKEKAMFIHTSNTIWSTAIDGRRKVVQVKTKGSSDPHMAVSYAPNPAFEQKALGSWAVASGGSAPAITMVAAPTSAVTTTVVAPTIADATTETLISFNPKQLILLEKAFDNGLTPRDLKTDVKKTNSEDKKKCQMVIRRARDEIVTTTKKRRKKNPPAAAKKAAAAAEEKEKPEPKKKETKTAKKEEEPEDSDDEPISAIKKKPAAKRASKAKSPAKPKKAEPKKEAPARKRGRPSTGGAKKESTTKRTRSKSRSKK
eukprot:CAMPEP_0113619970 /NCGR_PEP_ID=MMETSP0017_2-20120614/10158_1 /TAXON_ID=2856 /ORGANISM="Cylindrotheca closterium" /LENGTH=464 /DNA_ID=CAMNT_0000529589 /DNA_START=121 /DNA_END=1515 /DNA_ORIENTATION=- /assembly_acc=CAM_ASM_000147